MDNEGENATLNTHRWQKLSPIAVLYFIASGIKLAANNVIYLLPAIAISYSTVQENPQIWIPIIVGILALISVSSWLQYFFYSFRLIDETVEIRSGVFSKTHIDLPFSRIQNVTIERPLYYRLTHTCCLQLDTAGSTKQEAKIVALPVDFAEKLKQSILAKGKTHNTPTERQADEEKTLLEQPNVGIESEQILNTRSIKDLILHGITNNRVWIIIGALAPFYDNLAAYLASLAEQLGFDYERYFDAQSQAIWQLGLAFFSLVLFATLIITLISVVGSIVLFYDYSLAKTTDRYIRRSGLFTKQEVTMKRSRLQVIALKQDWLDVILGRVNLELKQNSSTEQNSNQLQANSNRILVPSVTQDEAHSIVKDALPNNKLHDISFLAISKRFIFRQLLWLIPFNLLVSAITFSKSGILGILVTQLLSGFIVFLIYCRWKRWGYADDDEYIYLRKGLFGVDFYSFPKYKVQQTQFIQSRMMRRHEIATINIIMASGALSIPFINQNDAKRILGNALFIVSKLKRSWM
ncbi:PH domain-containing protein [Aliiglaciecola sp. 2_MG-2023]|uniref:PH domain-containing protein n=1 Tax=unclassified Aliiglaciecola TaxID=2593648 RepID=UPI0026E1E01C|nr:MULTISPECIES: PH domain-containing protein [unclassified Aliiglaciecola]MDO6711656.1 PH domain-containing protein [Aliiglaciecola sp. 2_MG-2023]MDO6752727.1 PH domain-containing protein [Aliiglaciecola sp. 1_MG-2023]